MVAHDSDNVDVDAHTQFTVIETLLEALVEPALIASAGSAQENPVVLFANRPAEHFFNCSFNQIVGRPINEFFRKSQRTPAPPAEESGKYDLGDWGVAPLFDALGNCRYQVLIRIEVTPTARHFL